MHKNIYEERQEILQTQTKKKYARTQATEYNRSNRK